MSTGAILINQPKYNTKKPGLYNAKGIRASAKEFTMKFDRNLLPNPAEFYAANLARMKPGRNGWGLALCCFHPDKNPSLAVNLEKGAFKCFSCGAKGGDVLDFYRLRHNVDFMTAVKALGAVRGGGK